MRGPFLRNWQITGFLVVTGFSEFLSRIDIIELGIGCHRTMRCFEADRKTERLLLPDCLLDRILPERTIGESRVGVLLSILRHGFVGFGLVAGLTRPTAPHVKIAFAQTLAVQPVLYSYMPVITFARLAIQIAVVL